LSEFGFRVERVANDGAVTVRLVGQRGARTLRLTEHEELTVTALVRAGVRLDDAEALRLSEWISPKAADALRASRVNFVDTSGNAFIDVDDWFIDVRRRRRRSGAGEVPSQPTPRNSFSTKRSQVVFAILQWEGLLEADVRTVARVAGTSVGLAHRALAELRAQPEFWPSSGAARERLLAAWLASYATGLGAAHHLGRYRSDDLSRIRGRVSVSGDLAAAHLIKPSEAIVYVDELSAELVARNRWSLDAHGNVSVKRRFWREPEADEQSDPIEAPSLLVIADLASADDPRRREVSHALREMSGW